MIAEYAVKELDKKIISTNPGLTDMIEQEQKNVTADLSNQSSRTLVILVRKKNL